MPVQYLYGFPLLSLRNFGTDLAQSSSKKLVIYVKHGETRFAVAMSIYIYLFIYIFADILVVL